MDSFNFDTITSLQTRYRRASMYATWHQRSTGSVKLFRLNGKIIHIRFCRTSSLAKCAATVDFPEPGYARKHKVLSPLRSTSQTRMVWSTSSCVPLRQRFLRASALISLLRSWRNASSRHIDTETEWRQILQSDVVSVESTVLFELALKISNIDCVLYMYSSVKILLPSP